MSNGTRVRGIAGRSKMLVGVLLLFLTLCFAVGCGSSSSSSSSSATTESGGSAASESSTAAESSGGGEESSGGGESSLASFEAHLEQVAEEASAKQTQKPPTTGPKGAKDKSIVIIPPAGASTEGGWRIAQAAKDAAESLGWKVTLINPEGEQPRMAAAVERAITIHADGIVVVSIDGQVILSQLEQAKAAGIKLVAAAAANSEGETGIYESLVPSLKSGEEDGYALGAKAYELGEKKVNALQLNDKEFGYVVARHEGWQQFIDECKEKGGECETVNETQFIASDITTTLPQITASAAQANPGWNVLWSGFDSSLTFMMQGLQQAGLEQPGSFGVGFDGNTPNLNIIREGGFEKATIGLSSMWIGYAMIDNMNRLFHEQEPLSGEEEGIKNKLLTAENIPPKGPWWGDEDIRPYYWKLWGVHPTSPANPEEL